MDEPHSSLRGGQSLLHILRIKALIKAREAADADQSLLLTAAFQWIRRDPSQTIAKTLEDDVREEDGKELADGILHTAACIVQDEGKKRQLYIRLHDLQSGRGMRAWGRKRFPLAVAHLWDAMKTMFEYWEVPSRREIVPLDEVSGIMEKYIVICKSCQSLQQYEDSLSHADICISKLSNFFPEHANRLPNYAKLLAYAACLRVKLKLGQWRHARDQAQQAVNILISMDMMESLETAFVIDAYCRVLASEPVEKSAIDTSSVLSYQTWVKGIWNSFGSDFGRASSLTFLTDFQRDHFGDAMPPEAFVRGYEEAKRIFRRYEGYGVEKDNQRVCLGRRLVSLGGESPDSETSSEDNDEDDDETLEDVEPWKIELQEMSLWGLH